MTKTVIAIMAHPDDAEQFCGGTLLLLKQKGYRIVIAVLTAGECGSHTLTAEEIKKVRLDEAEVGAKKLGAAYINVGIHDGSVDYNLENTKKVVKLIREYDPEIIFTHPVVDYMTDHSHTGQLVLWAAPESTHTNFPAGTNAPALTLQPYVYHTDPQGLIGMDGQIVRVNTIVDVSKTIEKKLVAFATHKSQMTFLSMKKKGQIDSVEKTRRWAATRGQQVRVNYGEGFTQQLLEQYPRKNRLAELLKDQVYTL